MKTLAKTRIETLENSITNWYFDTPDQRQSWLDMAMALPEFDGRLTADAEVNTWFSAGGRAEILFRPKTLSSLAAVLKARPTDMLVTVLGATSNILIRDGGLQGLVIRLGRDFAEITCDMARNTVTAGAAALDPMVADVAATNGLGGLEFLSGIPGSIGGAAVMNAGAYGSDFYSHAQTVKAITLQGEILELDANTIPHTYRHADLPADIIVTGAVLQAISEDPNVVKQRILDIKARREETQPIREKTGGSTFKNPTNHPENYKAWQLIDKAGCRGLTVGDAQMSEFHCNFMLNTAKASAQDLESLGELVRQRVFDTSGIWLEWEIKRLGIPSV